MPKHNPTQFFLIAAAALICGMMAMFFFTMKLNIIHAYLIALNAVTFIIYGYDKRQAIKSKMRVPEIILHLLALIGGSPAAGLGQIIFRHKTKKVSFRIVFILIVIFQVAAYAAAVYLANKAA